MMKRQMTQVFGWVYRFDSPNYQDIMRVLDALKVTLLHHGVSYFVQPGAEYGGLFIDAVAFADANLMGDESYMRIEVELRGLCQ